MATDHLSASSQASRPSPTRARKLVIRIRWWLLWSTDSVRAYTTQVLRHRFFTVGLLWTLSLAGNLLLLPNFGIFLLFATVAVGAVRSGFNPITTVMTFIIAIFVVPARYAFLGMSFSMVLGLAALGMWTFHRMANGPVESLRPNRINRWILVFLAAKLISYANAQLHFRPPLQVAAADRQMIVFLAFAGIALYVGEVAKDRRQMHRLVNLIIAGGGFMALTAIIEQQTSIDVAAWLRPPGFSVGGRAGIDGVLFAPERFGVRRAFGSATGPLEYTTMILAVLPLAVHRAVYGRDRNERRYGSAMAFLIIVGLPMSVSRTAVIGLLMALILIGLGLKSPERRRLAAGFGVSLLFVLVTFSAVSSAFFQLTSSFFVESNTTNLQVEGRTDDYAVVGSLLSDRPLFGLGLAVHDPTVPQLVDGIRIRNLFLDNQYLSESLTGGVIGLAALVGLQVAGVGAAIRARRMAASLRDENLAYSVAASIMIMMLTFAFFDALAFRSTTGLFFVLLALAGALESNVFSLDNLNPETRERVRRANEAAEPLAELS